MAPTRDPRTRTFEKFSLFDRLPTIASGCQFVLLTRTGVYQSFPVGVQPRAADLRAARKTIELHTAPDTAVLSGFVASNADSFSFQLQGTVSYRIVDPVLIIERMVSDTHADVIQLVRLTVNIVTRNWNPHTVHETQLAVRRVVEEKGKAAEKLKANGYELLDIDIQLLRDERLRNIATQTDIITAEGTLKDAQRAEETKQIAHLEQMLAGGIYKRMAYFAAQGKENLDKAMASLDQHELEELAGKIRIMEAMAPQLQDHQQRKFIEDIRSQLNTRFAASKALQSEEVRGVLSDPQASPPVNPPSDDDDFYPQ